MGEIDILKNKHLRNLSKEKEKKEKRNAHGKILQRTTRGRETILPAGLGGWVDTEPAL